MKVIDLRSDTVTKPSVAMRAAMADAEVGDDVMGEDPTVVRLESMLAERTGMEAGLFTSSGTQGNLLALMSHCQRGDEYIVGQQAHTYKYEGGGAAVLGSIQPQPLDFEDDASLDLDKVSAAIKADDFHFARTRLLCLENTHGGKVVPLDYIARASEFCRAKGLSFHLDGARVFNAAVALGRPVDAITHHFDSVSICLSKGLGAPAGTVLCGSRELVDEARRWRKMVGGGMRQVGVLAAAGIVALEQHVERLAEDHRNAEALAKGLNQMPGVTIDDAQTNMVFMSVERESFDGLGETLEERGILIDWRGLDDKRARTRLVTHLDVSAEDIETVVAAMREHFQ